jgi:ferredoxin
MNDPGGAFGVVDVPSRVVGAVVDAAEDCPGECIFLELEPAGPVGDGR